MAIEGGLSAHRDFLKSMERLVTDAGRAPGEIEIIAGNLLDMTRAPEVAPAPSFDEFVRFANSLPRIKRTELHCHPDVVIALREAAPPPAYPPWRPPIGAIDLIVNADMQPGEWELREDGEVIKSGRLGDDLAQDPG